MEKAESTLFHDITIRIAKLINMLLMTTPFAVAWYKCYADKLWVAFAMRGHWLVIALFFMLYLIIGRVYQGLKMSYNSVGEMVYSQMLACFETDVIMYIVAFLLIRYIPPALPMVLVFAVQAIAATAWSIVAQNWYFTTFPAKETIIISDEPQVISDLIDKYKLDRKYKVIGSITVKECVDNIERLALARVVFLVGIHSHERNIITKYCLMNNIQAFLVPRVGDLILAGAKNSHMFHMLMLKVERSNPLIEYVITKRIMDIALSLIALILFSPIMLITAITIWIEDQGHVIYRQTRLTKNGKEFEMLKFRSMHADAEEDGIARLSSGEDDDRVTHVGKIIRRYRIDELPQLINILKGELSIVGPRAERPSLAQEFEQELPEFSLRLQVKAGLTGYAQVYGKYNTTPYDKLLMDLMYISNPSILEDLRIIFATIKIIFQAESTEGVNADQEIARPIREK